MTETPNDDDAPTVDDILSDPLRFAVCPNCSAEYPDFHSPVGTIETLCDECGWSSEEANPHYREGR